MANEKITKADIQRVRQTIADLSDLEKEITEASAMGLDCKEQSERCTHLKKFLIAWNEIKAPQVMNR